MTPNPLQMIEMAARTAYKSESKITDDSALSLISSLLNRNPPHDSVLEHASASFRITTDRGISHEIVRHRIASYTQESTRYCNYSKDKFGNEITVIDPSRVSEEVYNKRLQLYKLIENHYLWEINRGVPAQIARDCLPIGLKTELVMTCNFREWRHFLKLRCSSQAHPKMRNLASMIKMELQSRVPVIFEIGE